MSPTPLNSITVSENYTLKSFVITGVSVIPLTSADICVMITASTGRVFARNIPLEGDAYTAWQSDAYLYEYVAAYLATSFTP